MEKQLTLANVSFIYKDGNHYRFSCYQVMDVNNDLLYKKHELVVSIRKEIRFKFHKWVKKFYYYKDIPIKKTFKIRLDQSYSTKETIMREIDFLIQEFEESKLPKKTHLERVFSDFDGFICVLDRDKKSFIRQQTIGEVIK